MGTKWTRRTFVGALSLALEGQVVPSEQRRFRDPATEFELIRHTDPRANAWLLEDPAHAFSKKLGGLLYCSDRGGSPQAYRLDLKSGESRQLTDAKALKPPSLSCLPDDKTLVYFDGDTLVLAQKRTRQVYTSDGGWEQSGPVIAAADGDSAIFVEKRDVRRRLRVVGIRRGTASTVLETSEALDNIHARPKRPTIVYRSRDALWLIDLEGRNDRRLNIEGEAGSCAWSTDGRNLVYLSFPKQKGRLHQLREHTPESGEDREIAPTSQFVQFARNSDSSIFAGVSGSKASPYVLLLHRSTRRELTLAEHRASDARRVAVVFSPNSQRLFYHTDRDGRSVVYSLGLERFVEETDT